MAELAPKSTFVRKKKLQAELEHVNQEIYKRNLELKETNDTLALLRGIDTLVLESHDDLDTLCQQMATSISATADFPLVALLVHRPRLGHLELLGLQVDNEGAKHLPPDIQKKTVISSSEEWIEDDKQAVLAETHAEIVKLLHKYLKLTTNASDNLIKSLNLQSVYVAKLIARAKLVGLMVIGMDLPRAQHASGPGLLERLSQAVGVAVDNRLLFEENQRVLAQLQRNNEKLKALDEAKDEFISMASHQLRTPLTSMKGNVDMVVQGDVGKISAKQKKLLDQAFQSSQRMVYLISDLLNVSRLKTGKFVIEPVVSNLAEVAESELAQLTEVAKSRQVTISYKKPSKFPSLMLDETKIRQVMMNFVDNAIYYTPAGGHIDIKLKDTGKSVEFTVTDNGIGVPKEEQHKLFSKFYRAGNAKKARPDGTGLGLFMAKKVVAAQGGAIIFKSKEGEGSTFGFSFPKAKLKVPNHLEPQKN